MNTKNKENHATTDAPTRAQLEQRVTRYIESLNCSHGLWIGGKATPSSNGATFDVADPATTRVIAQMPDATRDDITRAVDSAAQAFTSFRSLSPRTRCEYLRRAYELMHDKADELAALTSYENGKSLSDSYAEVSYAAEFFRWYSEEGVRADGQYYEAPAGKTRTIVTHQPVGVAALITPWNFPAAMATRKIAPALAAGCSVVLKPASQTPLTALAVCHILKEAGVPDGVVNMITSSSSSEVSQLWLEDPRIRVVSFTGSTAVGSKLMEKAAKRIVNSSMELGGNASFIVGAGADIDAACEGAMIAKYRNGGQACTAANRFFVHEDVADEFITAYKQRVSSLRVGAAFDGGDIGPVIHDKARNTICELVEQATREGAKTIYECKDIPNSGYFVPPRIMEVSDASTTIMREEIFGPISVLTTFRDTDDVVKWANDTEMGLASYVFDRDIQWALKVAERLETGMIGINRGAISDPAAPFGGFKQSGIGREGAREGLREFQETQYFSIAWE